MSISFIILFSFLTAGSLIVLGFLLTQAAQHSPQVLMRKRMAAINGDPLAAEMDPQRITKGTLYSEIPLLHSFLAQLPFTPQLDLLLERAHVQMSVARLLFFCLCMGGMVFFFASMVFHQPFLFAFLMGGGASSLPCLYVKYLARKRLRRFLEQMPDGLDMISQGLQTGLGLTQAQGFVAREAPDPIGTEFGVFLDEMNLGLSTRGALTKFQLRVPLPEMRLFSTALLVQREVGGSLAEVLNKLADIIRERFRVEREIRTLTAQNRLAALVVCSLPPAVAALMFFTDPTLMNETIQTSIGRGMLIAACVMEGLGILAFRRLLRLHI